MRVAYVITRAEHGGAQTHLLELLNALRSAIDATVIVGEEGILTENLNRAGIAYRVIRALVRPINPVKDIVATAQLVGVLRAGRFNLVHAHTAKAGLVSRLAASALRLPCVFTPHGWAFSDRHNGLMQGIALMMERLLGHMTAAFICVANAEAELAFKKRISGQNRLFTIPNGIRDASGCSRRRSRRSEEDFPQLIMVARLAAPKDHELLINALSSIKLPLRLSLVGDGPLRSEIQQQISELGLADQVVMLGARDDISELLADSDLFVLASKSEALPISVIEAMRAELPVVASDVGGLAELVRNGVTGTLVRPGDPVAFRDAILKLIKDEHLRRAMGAEARKLYKERFCSHVMGRTTLEVYKHVLKQHVAVSRFGVVSGQMKPTLPAP